MEMALPMITRRGATFTMLEAAVVVGGRATAALAEMVGAAQEMTQEAPETIHPELTDLAEAEEVCKIYLRPLLKAEVG